MDLSTTNRTLVALQQPQEVVAISPIEALMDQEEAMVQGEALVV